MEENAIKALVSLLDDDDTEVLNHVEKEILALGSPIIPFLEDEWERNFNPKLQKRIEDLIHNLQFHQLKDRIAKWRDHHADDLMQGVWAISTYLYPDNDYDFFKQQLEQIYYDVWVDFKEAMHPYDQVRVLNNALFNRMRFRANTKNFYAPDNSMLNKVLETKRGNPISLCVVYMLIAQRLNLPVYGVNLPNNFVLTYKTADYQFYINAFNKGVIMSRVEIDAFIAQLNMSPAPEFYEPCAPADIILRMLRNLSVSFERQGDSQRVEEIGQLIQLFGKESESEDKEQ